ncbi:MAG TPA: DUF72 domain-containing protein [Burkholderiales bacterium]|nr:DUF72 domain-containing protein [Burkholderiales bacterium]
MILAGTSGYSYKEWLGHFYPEGLPAAEMLRFYGKRFATVEINNTFYRMPATVMLERWFQEVPDGFTFALKAPRRITHDMRLRDCESAVHALFERASVLEHKLGVVLFQLPHFLKKDMPRLQDFLETLPETRRVAFEFRHSSWQCEDVYDILRSRGALLCVTDTDEGDTPFLSTADCGYVRLRRTHYDERDLRSWAERIITQRLACTYVYFMHEDEALGCRFASMLNRVCAAPGPPG